MLEKDIVVLRRHLLDYPGLLFEALAEVEAECGDELFLVGGTIRDWLLGKTPNDLDFTVARDAVHCCRVLIRILGGGTFVSLGTAEEEAGRVVWRGLTVDFSSFRGGAVTIQEDLVRRDFTLNALALAFSPFRDPSREGEILDPLGGIQDLEQGVLRACPEAFAQDPLRMLRGYRLWARYGFSFEAGTLDDIRHHASRLGQVAVERISYEMAAIMASDRAHEVIAAMAESGLLFQVIPELEKGVGLSQPESHHLDVFGHSLAALGYMETIVVRPEIFYPQCVELLSEYLGRPGIVAILKWSALLHDLGKPQTRKIREDKGGRITFYNHDEQGAALVQDLGRTLHWANDLRDRVASLTAMHMHPFHLCNVRRSQGLSKKALLKLARRAGGDLIGLFLLSMADSLAGKGILKPEAMEEELGGLFCEVIDIYQKNIVSVLHGPPLVTGRDLIERFALKPGPLFSQILNELQEVQAEGEVRDREQALLWVRRTLRERGGPEGV